MVSVRGLVKRFGDRTVLQSIDLEVAQGEVVAIMGSSGGGKTTLLRCICGLLEPSEGSVFVDGIDVIQNAEEARRRMGMVFQSAALFDYMNVQDNVLFGIRRQLRLKKDKQLQVAYDVLRRVGLDGEGAKMPAELSGGMRKRVGIARALALNPRVLLYDEPTTGLDPITAYTIDSLIVDVCKEFHVTSVVVSHDVSSVYRVADRIAFLHEGHLIFDGTPTDFAKAQDASIRELVRKAQATTLAEPA